MEIKKPMKSLEILGNPKSKPDPCQKAENRSQKLDSPGPQGPRGPVGGPGREKKKQHKTMISVKFHKKILTRKVLESHQNGIQNASY